MFTSPWVVALSAIFVWWFSTGILLWRVRHADNHGPEAHMTSVLIGLPLLFAGVWGYSQTLGDLSVQGVYIAFLSALAIWKWAPARFWRPVRSRSGIRSTPPRWSGWAPQSRKVPRSSPRPQPTSKMRLAPKGRNPALSRSTRAFRARSDRFREFP